jgi:hypothetical protein
MKKIKKKRKKKNKIRKARSRMESQSGEQLVAEAAGSLTLT